MFLEFFFKLKNSRIPVSLNEFFTFLEALKLDFIEYDMKIPSEIYPSLHVTK